MDGNSNWGGGYPVARRYLDSVQVNQAPAVIDLALLAAGYRPPRRGGRFRYADLGCGTAFTTIGLAALYPEAEFLGVDFMPEHVAIAREVIAAAGLTNIRVIEASFADLADASPPEPFDYVAMQGVWAWVSGQTRQDLIRLLSRWVAPGGVVYNGYSAAAGWYDLLPMRTVFRNAAAATPHAPAAAGRGAVAAWLEAAGKPARQAAIWSRFSGLPDDYLMHDLAATEATAFWPGDVAGALTGAKLEFLGSAILGNQFDGLIFGPEWRGFLNDADRQGWGEAARDIALNRSFRHDLFGRGAVRLTAQEQHQALEKILVAPWPPRLRFESRPVQEGEMRAFGDGTATRLADALKSGPMSVTALAEALALPGHQGVQVVLMALARHELRQIADPDTEAAQRRSLAPWTRAMRERRAAGHSLPGLMSPVLSHMVSLTESEVAAACGDAAPSSELRAGLQRLGLDPDG